MSITLTGSAVIIGAIIVLLMALVFIAFLAIVLVYLSEIAWTRILHFTNFHKELYDFVKHKHLEKRKAMK